MKRKSIALIISAAMAINMLAGCGNSTNNTSSDATTETTEATEEAAEAESKSSGDMEDITLILCQRDEWLSTLESGSIAQAEELGINLTTLDAEADTSKLLQYIETARNDGQRAIIINIVDPETGVQCIEAAGDMKVVFVNRYPTDTSILNDNVVYVGSDETEAGRLQGEYLADYFKNEDKTDIKYLFLSGNIGATSTTLRTESVLQALKDNGINAQEATAPLVADFYRDEAIDMISPLLGTTDYDCIISNNDAMALGAIEAMKTAGIDATNIPIVGVDGTYDGLQAIKEGTLNMTSFQNGPGQGRAAMIAAKNLIEGKALDEGMEYTADESGHIVWVPFETVTADNVSDYE